MIRRWRQKTNPDILVDIQMNRYGTFDFDKSEKLIAIGQQKTSQAIDKYKLNSTSGDEDKQTRTDGKNHL